MKIKLKSLSQKYVNTHSDIGFGVLGRNEAVIALKQLINSIKDKKLLSSINKIKPGKNPSESLMKLIDWMKEQCSPIYFRAKKGKNYIGYTDADNMKQSILAFALDFLPDLTTMDRKLANLALRTCYAFAGYHGLGEVYYGNRLYNEEWVYDSLEDTLNHGATNPSDEAKKIFKEYHKTWEDYKKNFPKYKNRFRRYSSNWPGIEDISEELDNFICDYRLHFVIDSLKDMVSLCWGKTIAEYSLDGLTIFLEINGVQKDENGDWLIEDQGPLILEDRIMLVWGGQTLTGEDYVFYEIESAANSIAGEFGYTEYSRDIELEEDISLDEIIYDFNADREFFSNLEDMYTKFNNMRNGIMYGKLKNQIKNERKFQSGMYTEVLQTETLFSYIY